MSDEKLFDPKKWTKLESDERRRRMNPEKLRDALQLVGNETVLDIGCGTGFFAATLAPACGRLVGVDRSDEMLEVFRGKREFGALTNIELHQAMADRLPVESASVEIALHVCLLHEVPDVAALHAEVLRVLKPGGRLIAIDWEAHETDGGPPLDHRVSEEQAVVWMKRDGFSDVRPFALYGDQYAVHGARPA